MFERERRVPTLSPAAFIMPVLFAWDKLSQGAPGCSMSPAAPNIPGVVISLLSLCLCLGPRKGSHSRNSPPSPSLLCLPCFFGCPGLPPGCSSHLNLSFRTKEGPLALRKMGLLAARRFPPCPVMSAKEQRWRILWGHFEGHQRVAGPAALLPALLSWRS